VEVKVFIFSILLLNAQGIKITPGKVRRLISKTTAAAWEPGDQEVLEALVLLWRTALTASGRERPQLKTALKPGRANPVLRQPQSQSQSQPQPQPVTQDAIRDGAESHEAQLREGCPVSGARDAPGANERNLPENQSLPGRYLYGIGWGTPDRITVRGIDQAAVFGISYQEITAIVHACKCEPYQSEQRDLALAWLKQHQAVLDQTAPAFKCVIPVGFDIIIDGTLAADSDRVVQDWLAARYERIMDLLRRLAGKMEYGIQVAAAKAKMLSLARDSNPRIDELERKITTMSKGTAFLFQNELRNTLRESVDRLRETMKQNLKEQITPLAFELKEENTLGKEQNEQDELIANFSVLAETGVVAEIGAILEDFQNRWEATVAFTGPWPPYNFVAELD
jgi:hypothetical protein